MTTTEKTLNVIAEYRTKITELIAALELAQASQATAEDTVFSSRASMGRDFTTTTRDNEIEASIRSIRKANVDKKNELVVSVDAVHALANILIANLSDVVVPAPVVETPAVVEEEVPAEEVIADEVVGDTEVKPARKAGRPRSV